MRWELNGSIRNCKGKRHKRQLPMRLLDNSDDKFHSAHILCSGSTAHHMNITRGLQRAFIVFTPLWVVYCLLIYPMQQYSRAENNEKALFSSCWEKSNPPDFKGCAEYSILEAGTDMWTLKAFYSRESWLLILVIIAVPLLTYWCCRLLLWVWRGFVPA